MLWFNAAKDVGALSTEGGARVDVPGTAFRPDEKPAGRCAGTPVEFELLDGEISFVSFVEELSPRRARVRRYR